jgi:hypothetical protein
VSDTVDAGELLLVLRCTACLASCSHSVVLARCSQCTSQCEQCTMPATRQPISQHYVH